MDAWTRYLKMSWTTPQDKCEQDCGTTMGPDRYVEGDLGHYCSKACCAEAESGSFVDEAYWERRQMGLTAL